MTKVGSMTKAGSIVMARNMAKGGNMAKVVSRTKVESMAKGKPSGYLVDLLAGTEKWSSGKVQGRSEERKSLESEEGDMK